MLLGMKRQLLVLPLMRGRMRRILVLLAWTCYEKMMTTRKKNVMMTICTVGSCCKSFVGGIFDEWT
jgi:hypothetical protein